MSNIYHILHKVPAYEKEDMLIEYEELAQKLVKSGKVRIDADDKCNFAKFYDPEIDASIIASKEELMNEDLYDEKFKSLSAIYSKKFTGPNLKKKVEQIVSVLKNQLNKHLPVETELMLRLVRLLIQAAHPIIIYWILIEKTEVFISYSNTIGDVMDIVNWQRSGSNSGMQSTDGQNTAIFVSCGGDPFGKPNPTHPTLGDGWPAIARMQIIAGQEIGHYADIKRNAAGQQIGRHSANFACTKAVEHVRVARKYDIQNCIHIHQKLISFGLDKLIKNEQDIIFYRKNKVFGIRYIFALIVAFFRRQKLYFYASNKTNFIKIYKNEKYMGRMLEAIIKDMQVNLTPKADVYSREDLQEEEAIACIEALARVPQQVMKFGHITTKTLMFGLYQVYYGQVIPSLIDSYQKMTGKKYQRNYNYMPMTIIQRIKKMFSKSKLTPIRDLD